MSYDLSVDDIHHAHYVQKRNRHHLDGYHCWWMSVNAATPPVCYREVGTINCNLPALLPVERQNCEYVLPQDASLHRRSCVMRLILLAADPEGSAGSFLEKETQPTSLSNGNYLYPTG